MAEFRARVDAGHIETASWWQIKEARNKWNWDHQKVTPLQYWLF